MYDGGLGIAVFCHKFATSVEGARNAKLICMRNNLTCTVKSPGDYACNACNAYQEACFKQDGDAVYMCSAVTV